MFNQLTTLSYKRNWKQAVVFYFVYLFIFLISLLAFRLLTVNLLHLFNPRIFSMYVGITVSSVSCISFCIFILKKKNLFMGKKGIILSFICALLSFFIGSAGGLAMVAYITTLESKI